MAKEFFPIPLEAQVHVIRFRENLQNWEAGLKQAISEKDEAGIEFCTRCVETAKRQLAKAKEEALTPGLW